MTAPASATRHPQNAALAARGDAAVATGRDEARATSGVVTMPVAAAGNSPLEDTGSA
ncbi:MAG: hypothetical protein OEV40_01365 [Acidimicrobiia bacterium]|nr:hypothetical protein [Acidimicrobiia bacterium]